MITAIERLINAGLSGCGCAAGPPSPAPCGSPVPRWPRSWSRRCSSRDHPDPRAADGAAGRRDHPQGHRHQRGAAGRQRHRRRPAGRRLLRDRRADLVEPRCADRDLDHDRPAAPARPAHARGPDQRDAGARRRRRRSGGDRPDHGDADRRGRRCRGEHHLPAGDPRRNRRRRGAPVRHRVVQAADDGGRRAARSDHHGAGRALDGRGPRPQPACAADRQGRSTTPRTAAG